MSDESLRELVLRFCMSFCLADHIGDVAYDVGMLLDKMGIKDEWNDENELIEVLIAHGTTQTLSGTSMVDNDR